MEITASIFKKKDELGDGFLIDKVLDKTGMKVGPGGVEGIPRLWGVEAWPRQRAEQRWGSAVNGPGGGKWEARRSPPACSLSSGAPVAVHLCPPTIPLPPLQGTGKWTIQQAAELSVAAPTMEAALDSRFLSGAWGGLFLSILQAHAPRVSRRVLMLCLLVQLLHTFSTHCTCLPLVWHYPPCRPQG